jgi:gamma-glutamylcyclotransferase (GGCT)/AIG2-like uncharacterized protein YtfP
MFFYGTLREGFNLHNMVMKGASFLGKRRTIPAFSLYAHGYPWLTRNGSTAVVGELYEVEEKRFKMINNIEVGAGYNLEEIELEDGDRVMAYVYPREDELASSRNISKLDGGDFVDWKRSLVSA